MRPFMACLRGIPNRLGAPISVQSFVRHASTYGVCFDIEGVLSKGGEPMEEAKQAMQLLSDRNGEFTIPVAFVTNSLNLSHDRASELSRWLGVKIRPAQLVQAQRPLVMFDKFHDKQCLVIGQGKLKDIAKEVGFKNIWTMDDIATAYPLLDVVDHKKRKTVQMQENTPNFPPIDVILSLGEPTQWDRALQLVVDLLVTNGLPTKVAQRSPNHLPIIACNQDLHIMHKSPLPRYSHGAFLLCLEALYQKVSGFPLQYTALLGKPSEITYRFADHCLQQTGQQMGFPYVHTLYMVGDNPASDIVGPNLYKQQISKDSPSPIPSSRRVPADAPITPRTVRNVHSLLVCTGVYQPGQEKKDDGYTQAHRDYVITKQLATPTRVVDNVLKAVEYIVSSSFTTEDETSKRMEEALRG